MEFSHRVETAKSFDEYRQIVEDIRGKYGYFEEEVMVDNPRKNIVLFRGQSNAEWPVCSTLERTIDGPVTWRKYLLTAYSQVYKLGAISGQSWNLPDKSEVQTALNKDSVPSRIYLGGIEYLIFLRHHGFPSPFVDWTDSPYVALFFAFEEKLNCDYAAVWVYIERQHNIKLHAEGRPCISLVGQHLHTHPRHFMQQARYTIASTLESIGNRYIEAHQTVLNLEGSSQDVAIEIRIDRSLRSDILQMLNEFNVNHYSLYGSLDALVRSVATQAFVFEKW